MIDDSRTERQEAMHWLGMEIVEARKALWNGKSAKAFAAIEAAEEQYQELDALEVSDDD